MLILPYVWSDVSQFSPYGVIAREYIWLRWVSPYLQIVPRCCVTNVNTAGTALAISLSRLSSAVFSQQMLGSIIRPGLSLPTQVLDACIHNALYLNRGKYIAIQHTKYMSLSWEIQALENPD